MATFYSKEFSETTYIPIYQQRIGKRDIPHLDYLSINFQRALSFIDRSTPYVYRGFEHITTIAYAFYGNTSAWRIICDYNGIMHPLDIEPGTTIQIPDINQLSEVLANLSRSTSRSENADIGQTEEI